MKMDTTNGKASAMDAAMTAARLMALSKGLSRRFPSGNSPYAIMTRLLEECGELAEQVNHFENSGIKHLKHGEPAKAKMAKEVMDVLRCTIQVAQYYDLGNELEACVEGSFTRMREEGFISDSDTT